MIARASQPKDFAPHATQPRDFAPQCYSDNLECLMRMTSKIVSFYQDTNKVDINHCRGRENNSKIWNGFNDHHIKNTCFLLAIF